jgi:electron transfer flavoprotein beta subunit
MALLSPVLWKNLDPSFNFKLSLSRFPSGRRPMNIIICVKAVPYISGPVEVRENRKDIVKSNMNFKINDTDDNALEEALRLKEKFGGKVTVITVSENTYEKKVRQVLWECMAKGADEVVYLVDESFAELDSFTIAKLLSEVARKSL